MLKHTILYLLCIVLVLLCNIKVIPLQVALRRKEPSWFGGKAADLGELPWVVAVKVRLDPAAQECEGQQMAGVSEIACSGTILSPMWILSVADCVEEEHREDLEIEAGQSLLGNPQPDRRCSIVNTVITNGDYVHTQDNENTEVNLALLRINEALVFDDVIRNVELPKTKPNLFKGEAYMGGWGNNQHQKGNRVASKLQYANTKLVTLSECKAHFKRNTRTANLVDNIKDDDLCFKFVKHNIYYTRINKGGAVVDRGEMLGILSVAASEFDRCGYGVFVDVSKHLDFIKYNVEDLDYARGSNEYD